MNHFLILGIDEDASESQIEEAFRYLSNNLSPENFPPGSFAEKQAQWCMSCINPAYQSLHNPQTRARSLEIALVEKAKSFDPEEFKPFLGHICVAAGIITLEDLIEAVAKQADIDLPLGQILQEKQLLSQTELDGLLMGQRLFGAPNRPLDALATRLVAMSAVSKDMIKIVMIDQRTAYLSSIADLLLKRGWLSERILQVITDQAQMLSPM